MNGEIVDALYVVIATILNIRPEDIDYILLPSALATLLRIANDFPEVINGVDFSTGKSLETN